MNMWFLLRGNMEQNKILLIVCQELLLEYIIKEIKYTLLAGSQYTIVFWNCTSRATASSTLPASDSSASPTRDAAGSIRSPFGPFLNRLRHWISDINHSHNFFRIYKITWKWIPEKHFLIEQLLHESAEPIQDFLPRHLRVFFCAPGPQVVLHVS